MTRITGTWHLWFMYIYVTDWDLLRMRSFSDKFIDKIKTNLIQFFFAKIVACV
jgi:hypothetical protein